MLQISRQVLRLQSVQKLCARSMGKMDQFKWKRPKDKPNKKPKLSVILKEQHPKLGNPGKMVAVERGYGRNALVPQGIAVYATRENMRRYLKEEDASDVSPESQVCPKFMRFLKRTHLKIQRKDKEFFEVNEHQLALEYERQYQLYVPVHCITVEEPIRSFGEFKVNVAVREGVVVQMKVSVEKWTPLVPDRFKEVMEDNKKKVQAQKN